MDFHPLLDAKITFPHHLPSSTVKQLWVREVDVPVLDVVVREVAVEVVEVLLICRKNTEDLVLTAENREKNGSFEGVKTQN